MEYEQIRYQHWVAHTQYQRWVTEIESCYDRLDANTAWRIKYEVTGTLQQLMDMNCPRTRQVIQTMRNLFRLESEISTFLYIMMDREMVNCPVDLSIPQRQF